MIIQPMTKQEEIESVGRFASDLVLLFNEIRREMVTRLKSASSPQEALSVINVLDEPYEEQEDGRV